MNMNKAFKELFGTIKAEEELKDRTRAYLAVKTNGYTRAGKRKYMYHIYAAACVCTLLMLFGGRWLFFTPTAEISIDINPSIELGINRFDRVISVKGFNKEGQELSGGLDIKYKNYAEAMEQILHDDSIAQLLSHDEVMTITVISSDGEQSAEILAGVETCAAKQNNTYCYLARPEEVASAHEMGFSCGKYRAFLELQLLAPDIDPETVQGMTMREIRELINSLSVDSGKDTSNSNWGNGHHGHGSGGRQNGRQNRGQNGRQNGK